MIICKFTKRSLIIAHDNDEQCYLVENDELESDDI